MQAEGLVASGGEGKRSTSTEHLIQLQLQQLQKEKLRIFRDQEAILMKVDWFGAFAIFKLNLS